MPNDYITIKALVNEINNFAKGGKIDKVNMPEKDEICLNVRGCGQNRLLTVSCNANNPRIHLDGDKKQNPLTAPSFCMHLRKHLTGGIINSVSLLGEDRIICFDVTSHNEMRDKVNFLLIAEMMGRYSNILLVKGNSIISDTLKQVSYDTMTKRCLLAGAKYELPPQSKLLPTQSEEIRQLLTNYNGGDLAKFLISSVSGLALITARQILLESDVALNASRLDGKDIDRIINTLAEYCNIAESPKYSPCAMLNGSVGGDFFVTKYKEFDGLQPTESLNQAVVLCTVEKDRFERRQDRTKFLQKAYNSQRKKLLSKIEKDKNKLQECERTEEMKKFGDLILSNAWAIKKGDKIAKVTDYFDENSPIIEIPLDERLTPQQNSQAYYKKYSKLKRTFVAVTQQLEKLTQEIEYLETIAPSLELCSTSDEIAELEDELASIGALKKTRKDKKKTKPSQPIAYEIDEFVVLVGKNNLQNDKLTFKVANGGDLWIHTKDAHGSHVIVFAEARDIPDKVTQIACEIATFYSLGKKDGGSKIPCDYTQRRNLKRHPSGKPGMVLYTTYKTAMVTPDEHKEYLSK
ncbi:MAG: NFACT family protein [Clostridia bacterium]|nr:NFACT family protein [Clostridia bacterium]